MGQNGATLSKDIFPLYKTHMHACLGSQLHWHTDLHTVPYSWPWDVALVWQSSRNTWNARMDFSRAERMFTPESCCIMSKMYAVCHGSLRRAYPERRILDKRTAYHRLAARIRDAGSMRDEKPSGQLLSLTNANLADVRLRWTESLRISTKDSVTERDWFTVSLLRCAKCLKLVGLTLCINSKNWTKQKEWTTLSSSSDTPGIVPTSWTRFYCPDILLTIAKWCRLSMKITYER